MVALPLDAMLTQLSQARLCKSFFPIFACKEPWAKICCCSGVLLRMPWTTAPSPSSASWFCRRSVGKQLQYCIYFFFNIQLENGEVLFLSCLFLKTTKTMRNLQSQNSVTAAAALIEAQRIFFFLLENQTLWRSNFQATWTVSCLMQLKFDKELVV